MDNKMTLLSSRRNGEGVSSLLTDPLLQDRAVANEHQPFPEDASLSTDLSYLIPACLKKSKHLVAAVLFQLWLWMALLDCAGPEPAPLLLFPLLFSSCTFILYILKKDSDPAKEEFPSSCYQKAQIKLERNMPSILRRLHLLLLVLLVLAEPDETEAMCVVLSFTAGPLLMVATAMLVQRHGGRWRRLLRERNMLYKLLWQQEHESSLKKENSRTRTTARLLCILHRILPAVCLVIAGLMYYKLAKHYAASHFVTGNVIRSLFIVLLGGSYSFVTWLSSQMLSMILVQVSDMQKWRKVSLVSLVASHILAMVSILTRRDPLDGIQVGAAIVLLFSCVQIAAYILVLARCLPQWRATSEERKRLWSVWAEEREWSGPNDGHIMQVV